MDCVFLGISRLDARLLSWIMSHVKILGIDPGYGIVGWGLVEPGVGSLTAGKPLYGVIRTSAGTPSHERMAIILRDTTELLNTYLPDCVVVEKLYMNKNIKTAGEVFQARGVILAAIAEFGCEIIEINPNQIKHMVTGRGNAGKAEVTLMVQRLLNIQKKITPDDAADALAGAVAGSFLMQSRAVIRRSVIPGAK